MSPALLNFDEIEILEQDVNEILFKLETLDESNIFESKRIESHTRELEQILTKIQASRKTLLS